MANLKSFLLGAGTGLLGAHLGGSLSSILSHSSSDDIGIPGYDDETPMNTNQPTNLFNFSDSTKNFLLGTAAGAGGMAAAGLGYSAWQHRNQIRSNIARGVRRAGVVTGRKIDLIGQSLARKIAPKTTSSTAVPPKPASGLSSALKSASSESTPSKK